MNQIINTNTITHDINNFKAVFSQDRKIIGLDVGKKTIGIAISDPISKIALTHKTIFRKKLKGNIFLAFSLHQIATCALCSRMHIFDKKWSN